MGAPPGGGLGYGTFTRCHGRNGAGLRRFARLDVLLWDDVGLIYLEDTAELADIHAGAAVNAQIGINGVNTVNDGNRIAWASVHAAVAGGASIGIDYEHESLFLGIMMTNAANAALWPNIA